MSISFSDDVNEEILTTTATLPEDNNEGSLRPKTISEYIGQWKKIIIPIEKDGQLKRYEVQ